MKRSVFYSLLFAVLTVSCANMDKREARYDESECPFCSTKPGECAYCEATGKCTFCKGTGVRTTGTSAMPTEGVAQATYQEKCPYCKATGVCRYCQGNKQCWSCEGHGKITSWDFYGKYQKLIGKSPTPAPAAQPDSIAPTKTE